MSDEKGKEDGQVATEPEAVAPPAKSKREEHEVIPRLLVGGGLMSEDQLRYARRVREKLPGQHTLISVIRELGYIDDSAIRKTLFDNRSLVRLGDVLLELGYIRYAELDSALTIQREEGKKRRLGEILVDQQFIDRSTLFEVLSVQLGIEHVGGHDVRADPQLGQRAAPKVMRENSFVPLSLESSGSARVAFADPLDARAQQVASRLFGAKVVPVLADVRAINQAIEELERHGSPSKTEAGPSESAVVSRVNKLIEDAIANDASDIHLEPMKDRVRVRYRQDGVLVPHEDIDLEMASSLASRIKIMAGADIAEKRRHQDGRILFRSQGNTFDLRVSIYVTIHGEKIVMRLLNKKNTLLNIRETGLSPRMEQRFVEDALDAPSGVVIVTGPTGSGKTTTLYAGVNHLNNVNTSIITAEDPVEYVIDGITQCSINPKISVTYEETLKHIVRQDPDVIVIGEIRDLFSAEIAIQAALTGHKVLTTFHTEDSIGGLLRLLNMNIEAFLISSTVVSVLAQRLLRRICPHCGEDHVLSPHELRRLGYKPQDAGTMIFKRPTGCRACRYSGYKGRVAIFELLVLNEDVKDALIARKTSYEIRRISTESTGLVTLLEDGIFKAAHGQTSFEEIMRSLPRLSPPRPLHEIRRLQGERA